MFSTPQFRNWKVWNASSKIRKYSLFENIHLLKIHFFGTEIFRVDTQYLLLDCSHCERIGPPKWSFFGWMTGSFRTELVEFYFDSEIFDDILVNIRLQKLSTSVWYMTLVTISTLWRCLIRREKCHAEWQHDVMTRDKIIDYYKILKF